MAATIESAMESSSPISMSFDEKRQAQTNSIPTSVTASVSDGAVTDPEAANEKVSEQKKSSSGVPLKDDGTPLRPGGWRWILILASMYSCMFLLALDNTIVADIQPAIIAEYNDIAKLSWLAGAYLIGTASTNLVWGKVFASFEVKYTYWVTIILFEVGSALCGAAPTMDALIVGRVIAGVGSSGMYVGVMTIAAATTTLAERPTYVALGAVLWGVGTVLGPIVGGAFSISAGGWRWAFYINLFIGAFFLPVYLFMIPKHDPRPNVSQRQRFKELDWIGTLLIVGAFVSFVMALSYGGTVYPWNSGQIIALFVVSGVLFIALGFQQELAWFTSPARRIFPVVFLRSRTMLLLFALSACGGVGILVPLYM